MKFRRITVSNKHLAWMMGIGLGLYPVHNAYQPLMQYFFLPDVGLVLMLIAIVKYSEQMPKNLLKWGWGSKWLWIPMLVIVGSVWARVPIERTSHAVAGGVFITVMLFVYVIARKMGKDIFYALLPMVLIEVASAIVCGLVWPAHLTGGIISSSNNYDIATGYMILGLASIPDKRQWLFISFGLVGIFFLGSSEAVFAIAILGAVTLLRREWNMRFIKAIAPVSLVAVIWLLLGYLPELYSRTGDAISTAFDGHAVESPPAPEVVKEPVLVPIGDKLIKQEDLALPVPGRLIVIKESLEHLAPLGHGFEWMKNTPSSVHNVPLIVVDQIGPLAGLAWLVIAVYCLWKTKYKYAWVAVLALAAFDHYIWDQMALWWWALVGVSTSSKLDNDLIFRRDNEIS